jgi:hypothetical protein
MAIMLLGDLQRAYRARQNSKHRNELRHYLIDRVEPSAPAYQIVSRHLYADGQIDNLGLADAWLAGASMKERATLFSEIATAFLRV